MTFLFLMAAFIYSILGHAGASAYTPLALASGMGPAEARSAALVLNLLVSTLAGFSFALAGHLRARVAVPLLLGSMPFAFLASRLHLNWPWLSYGAALAMLWAAWRLTLGWGAPEDKRDLEPASPGSLFGAGAGLGLLSGLTGIGGGIYLSPLLMLKRWATARQAAALSACFIFCNSAVSLAATGVRAWPRPEWAAACLAGGLLGAALGAGKLSPAVLRTTLGCALVLAAFTAVLK